jgi:hypothetical protein
VDTSSAARGGLDATRRQGGRRDSTGARGSQSTSRVPAVVNVTLVLTGPDGTPLIGPDGKPVTLDVNQFNTELTPNAEASVLGAEKDKYESGWFTNYRPVDPKSRPTRKQDCGGNALEQLWGIKRVVVSAERFHDKIVKGTGAEEISRATPNGSIDWTRVKDKDVGVMFKPGGEPGHIFVVKSAENRTIITKDGNERVREGQLSVGDDLHNSYRGDIAIYRVNPGAVRVSRK